VKERAGEVFRRVAVRASRVAAGTRGACLLGRPCRDVRYLRFSSRRDPPLRWFVDSQAQGSDAMTHRHDNECQKTGQLNAKEGKSNGHEGIGLHMGYMDQGLTHAGNQDNGA